jgi:hypothetical protein
LQVLGSVVEEFQKLSILKIEAAVWNLILDLEWWSK